MQAHTFLRGLAFGLILPVCGASILEVPSQYATIESAINAVAAHDTVYVHPGTYPERIIFPATNFALLSEYAFTADTDAINNTIIDASAFEANDTSSTLVFANGNDTTMLVCGFTVRGGHGVLYLDDVKYGGGIFVVNSSPTCRANHITCNQSPRYAAVVMVNSYGRMIQNSIFDNCADYRGMILLLGNYALGEPALFESNDVYGNYSCLNPNSFDLGDPGLFSVGSRAITRFNHFHDYGGHDALGVQYFYDSSGEIYGNIFERINGVGSVVAVSRHDAVLHDNIFRDSQLIDGECIALVRTSTFGTSLVTHNWFENIYSGQTGPGCIYAQHPNIHIAENVFLNCTGGSAGGIQLSQMLEEGCVGEIEHNQFLGMQFWHSDSGYGSAIFATGRGSLCAVHDNWFEGNQAPVVAYEFNDHLPWDLSQNYWGDSAGPWHPTLNPDGMGDTLYGDFVIAPWLTDPPIDQVKTPYAPVTAKWSLSNVYPNPFNLSTRLHLTSDRSQAFEITAFNISGQLVRTIWRGLVPGNTTVDVTWDGQDAQYRSCASGLYLIAARPLTGSNRVVQTAKALLLR
jgi:hypothetical protein